jgi:serine/threonine protein kinase
MKDRIYTEKADIYSFGVMLYEMLTHKQFFEDERFFSKMEQRIIAGERPELPPCPFPEFEQLIRECWASDADLRPSFATIIEKVTAIMKYAQLCPLVRACHMHFSHCV